MAENRAKPIRLIDVAKRAKVSRVVAGNVLLGSGASTRVSTATADRVRQIARDMGYHPNLVARQLSGKRTRTIGAVIGANRYPVHYESLRAIDAEASRRGYRLMVGYLHAEEPGQFDRELIEQLDDFEGRGMEGVILLHSLNNLSASLRRRFSQVRLPLIQTSGQEPAEACTVHVDLFKGMQMLYDHLVARGRQRISLLLAHHAISRREGFKAAAARHGRPIDNSIWACNLSRDVMQPPSIRPFVEAGVAELAGRLKMDAIMATNDQWAVQTIKVLSDMGLRVPEDVAVTGVDNTDIAQAVIPELTTIDQCNADLACAVFDLLEASLKHQPLTAQQRHIVLTPRLVVREST